jgi:hypothetical protein
LCSGEQRVLRVIMFGETGFCRNDYGHSDLFLEFFGRDHPFRAPELQVYEFLIHYKIA